MKLNAILQLHYTTRFCLPQEFDSRLLLSVAFSPESHHSAAQEAATRKWRGGGEKKREKAHRWWKHGSRSPPSVRNCSTGSYCTVFESVGRQLGSRSHHPDTQQRLRLRKLAALLTPSCPVQITLAVIEHIKHGQVSTRQWTSNLVIPTGWRGCLKVCMCIRHGGITS